MSRAHGASGRIGAVAEFLRGLKHALLSLDLDPDSSGASGEDMRDRGRCESDMPGDVNGGDAAVDIFH
jgi:hypothetical protein